MKHFLSLDVAESLGKALAEVVPKYDLHTFMRVIEPGYEDLAVKARAFRIAEAYRSCLPESYEEALSLMLKSLPPAFKDEENIALNGFRFWPAACFIEAYGLAHLEASLKGMHAVTQRFSAEFAIRPYLQQYPDEVFECLGKWIKDESLHVRRLVSEGTRPRLPWAGRLPVYIDGKNNILPLLNILKNDPELYVRRSVANHLNDLTKDHPEVVLDVCTEWKKEATERSDWVIKHALRSLIKAGSSRALSLLGFEPVKVEVVAFRTYQKEHRIGETVIFLLEIKNASKEAASLAVDYVVHFVKANGSTSEKVFKWATPKVDVGATIHLSKSLPLLQRSTRTLYPGIHKVEVQVNGERLGATAFTLA